MLRRISSSLPCSAPFSSTAILTSGEKLSNVRGSVQFLLNPYYQATALSYHLTRNPRNHVNFRKPHPILQPLSPLDPLSKQTKPPLQLRITNTVAFPGRPLSKL